jgi:hypothetical protein
LTQSFPARLEPPAGLPWEILIRGADASAQALLDHLSSTIASILSDARIKELAITPKGVRIIRQAGEGRRGDHLLLRQAVFDDAAVPASELSSILSSLDVIREQALALASEVKAA